MDVELGDNGAPGYCCYAAIAQLLDRGGIRVKMPPRDHFVRGGELYKKEATLVTLQQNKAKPHSAWFRAAAAPLRDSGALWSTKVLQQGPSGEMGENSTNKASIIGVLNLTECC